MNFFAVVMVTALAVVGGHAGHFCYEGSPEQETCGEAHWDGIACTHGTQQSPIDIKSSNVKIARSPVTFAFNQEYIKGVQNSYILNNGHTVQLSATKDLTSRMTIKPSNSPNTYVFGQMHCHWQSEHQINSQMYGMECHLVHYNSKFDNISTAVANAQQDALMIIGAFFNQTSNNFKKVETSFVQSVLSILGGKLAPLNKHNSGIDAITKNLKNVEEPVEGPIETGTPFSPYNIINPENKPTIEAYNYMGSLTTPGCNEGMDWYVLTGIQNLSNEQWAAFDSIKTENNETMRGNHRGLQALNGRTVTLQTIQTRAA